MNIPVAFNSLAELPEGWSWQPLQSLTANPKQDVVDGPFGSDLKASEYVSSGVPIARLQNIDRNAFVTKNIRFLTPEKAADLARHEFRPDDILITKLGDPLGKACIVPASIGRGVIVADLVRVRPDEKLVDRKYLTYAINSPTLVKQFELHTKGTTRPRVNLSVLRQLPIPMAPRAKQNEIVAELEKQFSRLDEAVANLQRVKANLKRYKASVLKAAVEGRLVETEASLAHREGRTFETGEQLLQRIHEERRAKWSGRGKYKEPVAPDEEGLHNLPEGWVWCACDQISEKITDGEHISPSTITHGVPLLSAKDVLDTGVTFDDAKFVSAVDSEKFRSRCNPDRDDALIVSRGATIGRACLVNSDRVFCLMGSVILMKPHAAVSSAYLLHALKAGFFQTRLTAVSGSTAQQAIYIRDIRPLQMPLPPQIEQARIVSEVDRHLSIVREVEAEVDTNLKRAQALRQATLAKAFARTSGVAE